MIHAIERALLRWVERFRTLARRKIFVPPHVFVDRIVSHVFSDQNVGNGAGIKIPKALPCSEATLPLPGQAFAG